MKVQTRNIIIKKKSFVKSKVFKSSPDVSLMKSAKSTVTNKTSIFDTGASRSGTSDSIQDLSTIQLSIFQILLITVCHSYVVKVTEMVVRRARKQLTKDFSKDR